MLSPFFFHFHIEYNITSIGVGFLPNILFLIYNRKLQIYFLNFFFLSEIISRKSESKNEDVIDKHTVQCHTKVASMGVAIQNEEYRISIVPLKKLSILWVYKTGEQIGKMDAVKLALILQIHIKHDSMVCELG